MSNKTLSYYAIGILLLVLCVGVVSTEPPKCILLVKPTSGEAPLTVMASEESLDETIVDWKFNFGDGTIVTKSGKVEHVYDKTGEYTVELGVLNEKGEESKDTAIVTVTAPVTPEPTPTPTVTPTPKPTMNETTTVKVVYEGLTPIKDSLTSPSKTSSDAGILKAATESVMSKVSYPYNVTKEETKTTFKIVKYRCDEKMGICGYWIEAWRDGKEVYTNSPIWLSLPNDGYEIVVSESYDEKTNEITQIVEEDPKETIETILQQYVDRQPLGKAVVGTKE